MTGSAGDLVNALAGTFASAHNGEVKITGTYTTTQLKSINAGTDGALHLDDRTVAISGTASNVKAALAGNFTANKTHTGVVTLSDTGTVTATDITDISTAKGSGNINITSAVTLSGSGSEVQGAAAALNTIHGSTAASVTGTDYTVSQLKAINDKVGGTITLATSTAVTLTGSAGDLVDALDGNFTSAHNGEVKVTGNYNTTQLKSINAGTDGALHLDDRTVALSGTASNVKAALAGNFTANKTHTGVVTLTDTSTVTATDITDISTAKGSGNINITSAVTLSGSGSEVKAAAAALNTIHGSTAANVTGTNYNVSQLKAINDKVGGTITLADSTTVTLTGSAGDLVDALDGSFTSAHTGEVKITGNYNTTQLKAINSGTDGALHLDDRTVAISGSGSDLAAALTGSFTSGETHTGVVKVTGGDYNVSDLVTINNANEGGEINLDNRTVGLSGTATNVKAALAGSFTTNKTHTGVVTLTDTSTVTATDITDISTAKGSGNINITSAVTLSGSGSEVKAAAAALNTIHGSTAASVTGDDYNVSQLKAINDKVGGTITLATSTAVTLTGSAGDLVDALDGTFAAAHNGEVKVTGNYNVTQLKAINAGTDGALHLDDRTVAISGTAANVKAALAGTFTTNKTHTGVVTISDNTSSTVTATDITDISTAKGEI